jgi:hypothetical protein
MHEHRFPPPWSVEEQEACFAVRAANVAKLPELFYGTSQPTLQKPQRGLLSAPVQAFRAGTLSGLRLR